MDALAFLLFRNRLGVQVFVQLSQALSIKNRNKGLIMLDSPAVHAKRMIIVIIAAALLIMAAGIIFASTSDSISPLAFCIGVAFSASWNVLKTLWLKKTVEVAVHMETEAASAYIRGQYFLRFFVTGVIIALAHFIPFIDLWGAICGILTMPVAAHSLQFFIRHDLKREASSEMSNETVTNNKED